MHHIQSKHNLCTLVLLVCFSLCLSGCGNKQKLPDGMPTPHPTVITVVQDGKPLEGATVTLMPMESSNNWSAGAVTDSSGKASIRTLSQYTGAVPGKYYVIISKREVDQSKLTEPDPETDPQGYAKFLEDSAREQIASYDLVDPKFGKMTLDGETIEVVAGKNEKNIDVGKAVRVKR